MIEEIRKNAPNGATHYFFGEDWVAYVKTENSQVYFYPNFMRSWIEAIPNEVPPEAKPL